VASLQVDDGAPTSRREGGACRLDPYGGVVFDLDDTLYPERDYVRSGFDYLGRLVERLYHTPFQQPLREAEQSGCRDPLAQALQAAGLPASLKEHLILAYRYHQPSLTLYPGAWELLQRCRARGCPLYLVTDGRSVTQRLKLDALGLSQVFDEVFISEEVGVGKPHPRAFETIVARGEGPWVYVADNPRKDFQAPHRLGWTTIGVRHRASRVHAEPPDGQAPTFWVEELADLLS
jgi:putative hydrolase of the HAD superfamily